MTKTELKENTAKITQILQSESYEAGFELLKTLDDPELTAGLSDVIDTTLREKYFKENALEEGLEIAGILQLTELDLSSCESLLNLDGLANLTKLTSLNLSYCDKVQNVDVLANLPNLRSLDLRNCNEVHPKPSIEEMTTRAEVAAYQKRIKKAMK